MSKSRRSSTLALRLSLIIVFFAFVESARSPTCPIDVVFRMDACATLVSRGNFYAGQCCRIIRGLETIVAADCLCVNFQANFSPRKNVDLDVQIGLVFKLCSTQRPYGYSCV